MAAMVDHVSVADDHSSASYTAWARSTPSVVRPPPTTSTVPSGRMVRLWWPRGKAIGAVSRHAGEGWVMSMTHVWLTAGALGRSTSAGLPDLTTRPGRYIAALPPPTGTGSTTVHVCA